MFHTNEMLEPIVLHGDFAVQYQERNMLLVPLPKSLAYGDLCLQGLENYLGDVILKMQVAGREKPRGIFLPEVSAGATTITVNGKNLGTRLWGPYTFDLQRATWNAKGTNEITVTLASNLGLLLKRRYGCARYPSRPFGLLKAPQLLE